jgi:hypothetical protein
MNGITAIIIVASVVALIIFGPFLTIWSINTLFGLGIVYTFKTWLAVVLLASAFRAPVHNSK